MIIDKKKEVCHHPQMRPTHWGQAKPEPREMIGCECGQNMTCPECGYGRGAFPCQCMREAMARRRYPEQPARIYL